MTHRPGSMLLELALAVTLLLAASAATAQLLILAGHQRREARHRAVATREAANVMERVVATGWEEVTPERTRDLRLSAATIELLREATMEITVSNAAAEVRERRIDIVIRWQNAAGLPAQAVELSAWMFAPPGVPE